MTKNLQPLNLDIWKQFSYISWDYMVAIQCKVVIHENIKR